MTSKTPKPGRVSVQPQEENEKRVPSRPPALKSPKVKVEPTIVEKEPMEKRKTLPQKEWVYLAHPDESIGVREISQLPESNLALSAIHYGVAINGAGKIKIFVNNNAKKPQPRVIYPDQWANCQLSDNECENLKALIKSVRNKPEDELVTFEAKDKLVGILEELVASPDETTYSKYSIHKPVKKEEKGKRSLEQMVDGEGKDKKKKKKKKIEKSGDDEIDVKEIFKNRAVLFCKSLLDRVEKQKTNDFIKMEKEFNEWIIEFAK